MSIDARFCVNRGDFVLDVDIRIPGQGVTALFGRSGSGKTTILRCIAGLENIPGGHLSYNEQVWQDRDRFLPVHRRPLGYVFQESSLFPHLRVLRNLEFGMKRIPPNERKVGFDETVRLLGLSELLDRYPDELSGGQRQRVSIGRALLTSPRLLLMDEPMASLDITSKGEILPYLERLHDQLSIPVVYVSHSIEEVTRLADHMVLLEDGKVLAQGPLQDILTRGDLPLAHSDTASAVIEATVSRHEDQDHLTELEFPGGRLLVSREKKAVSERVRARIMARDVAIALEPPVSTSVLNCMEATVLDSSADPRPGHLLVRLRVGEQVLLSRITRRSFEHLDLHPGRRIWAMVKSVAIT